MNLKKLLLAVTIVFAGLIETGCGNSNPSTNAYNQYQNGCPVGQSLINGICTYTGANNGFNNGTNVGSCTQGPSYQYTGGTYGNCNPGYVMQGLTCVCQTGGNVNPNTGVVGGLSQGTCTVGYLQTPYGCYQQGPCRPGDAFITPYGQCYHSGY